MKLQKKIPSRMDQFLDELFLDTLFQDSEKLRRVTRWLARLAWLALITVPLIIFNDVLLFFTMQTGLSQGFIDIGNTSKLISALNVTDILEIFGSQIEGMLEPVAFWLGIFLLLRMTRHILYLVFDIKNAPRS